MKCPWKKRIYFSWLMKVKVVSFMVHEFSMKMMLMEHTPWNSAIKLMLHVFHDSLKNRCKRNTKFNGSWKMFHTPWNCSFGSHNIYYYGFTLKISFLYTKSIMRDIIITKEAAAAECYRHIHDFVLKKTFQTSRWELWHYIHW